MSATEVGALLATGWSTFGGPRTAAERQLAVDYKQTLDWSALAELEDVTDLEAAAAGMLESEVFRTESTFDALGRPTTQTTPDGSVVRLAYNEAALLDGVSANVRGAVTATDFVSNIDYDAKGRRTLIAYGNGTETSYSYDDVTQRLTRLRTTDATRTFQDLAYTYDVVGNIVEIGDGAQDDVYFGGAVVTATQRYEYDALYRLTHAEGREHAGQNAAQPTEFGASASLHPQDGTAMRTYTEQYVYDVVGNILSMQHGAASGNWTRRYQYASSGNRLEANSAPGDAAGVFSHGYTYDAHGNMTSMPHLSAVVWNYADQMRSADLGGGGTAYFVYDGAGQRVRKVRENVSGTQTYERIYLGAYELYRERTSGAVQLERETLHVADDGGRMCDVETRTVESGSPVASPTTHHRYQYSNHLGSASLELTQTAEVISYEEYHPYGTSAYRAVNSSVDVSERTYRYTGKERDEETGLGYHGARYYACWLGRWTASDPIGLGDGVNRYAYVSGRPTSLADPSGAAGQIACGTNPDGTLIMCAEPSSQARAAQLQATGAGDSLLPFQYAEQPPPVESDPVARKETSVVATGGDSGSTGARHVSIAPRITVNIVEHGPSIQETFRDTNGDLPVDAYIRGGLVAVESTLNGMFSWPSDLEESVNLGFEAAETGSAEAAGGAVLYAAMGTAGVFGWAAALKPKPSTGGAPKVRRPTKPKKSTTAKLQSADEVLPPKGGPLFTSADDLPKTKSGTRRIYRGTQNPEQPQVGAKYRDDPSAAPPPGRRLSAAEAEQHVAFVEPDPRAVSATTDLPTALRYPTPAHGEVVVYDVPITFLEDFVVEGDPLLGELLFPDQIPDTFRIGRLVK